LRVKGPTRPVLYNSTRPTNSGTYTGIYMGKREQERGPPAEFRLHYSRDKVPKGFGVEGLGFRGLGFRV
jgi:hypothetical protein